MKTVVPLATVCPGPGIWLRTRPAAVRLKAALSATSLIVWKLVALFVRPAAWMARLASASDRPITLGTAITLAFVCGAGAGSVGVGCACGWAGGTGAAGVGVAVG